jgi:RHS repeat-associated protein
MHSSLKLTAALLVNLSLVAHQVFAQLPPISFETYESVPVDLSSPDPWESIYGNSAVTPAGQGFGGGKALKIGVDPAQEAWLRKPVAWNAAESIAFIDFRIKPAATPEGSEANFFANGTQVAFQLPDGSTTGRLWVLHGNDDALPGPPDNTVAEEKWYLTAGTFAVAAGQTVSTDWVRATLRHDYGRKIWDLFIDGKLAAVNLGFEGRGPNLEHLEFFGSKAGDTLIDNLEANPSNMLFPDADKDGLPDAWEIANGSNPNLYDRDLIDPATGKSFLNKYLDSLWNPQTPGTPVNGSSGTGIVGTVPPLTILNSHQPVGALKGQFAVGGDGAATYTIPLDVPKGRAGMEPKLSLNYSSNAGNGPLGVGWSIGGLQKITRGPSSLKKDGIADGADFDANDRFYLDGERLVCVDGTYGEIGSEYRTELDSFARIKAVGLPGDLPGSPPAFWTVETKSGLTVTLGGKADSRVDIAGSGVLSWLVSEVADTTGHNSYQVDYCDNDEASAAPTASGRYPWKVRYTIDPANPSDTGFCSMVFDYETRPDLSSGYVRGVRQEANLRLRRVAVKTGTYLNHAYNFFYTTSEQTGRSLLYGVDKEAADGSRVPATSFQWESLSHSAPKWVEAGHLDFNEYGSGQDSGSSMASYVSVSESDPTEIHLTGNAWRAYPLSPSTPATPYTVTANTYLVFDYKTTAVEPKWGMIGLDEDVSTGNPKRLFKLVGGALPPVSAYSDNAWKYTGAGAWQTLTIPVGQNYTGVMNYLALVNDDNTVNDGVGESRFRNIRLYEGNPAGSGVLARTITFDQAIATPRILDGNNEDLGVRIQDLDGDGLPDIAYNLLHGKTSGSGPVTLQTFGQALRNTGSDFVNDATLKLPPTIPTGNLPGAGEGQFANSQAIYPVPVDINGDGQLDYAYAKNLTRESNGTFTCEHGYLTRVNNAWVELTAYAHHFKSNCASSQKRFSHFDHIDLDSDGDLDLLVHPYGATLTLLPGKDNTLPLASFPIVGNSGNNVGVAYLNKFQEGLGWVGASDWRLPVPLRIPGFNGNGGEVGRSIQDLNGDGRPDLYSALWQDNKNVWLNKDDATGWLPKDSGSVHQIPENLTNSNGDDVGTRLVDVNGDGRVDVIKALGSGSLNLQVGVSLNTGSGWISHSGTSAPWLPQENFNTIDKRKEVQEQGTSFVDLNADGLVDFVVSKPTINTVALNTGSGFWHESTRDPNTNIVTHNPYWAITGTNPPIPGANATGSWRLPDLIYPNTTASTNGIRHAMLVDLNGDGVSDLIGDMKSPVPRIWINQAKPERIISFTDGFAASIQVDTYARLNDPTPVPNSLGLNRRVYDRTPVSDDDADTTWDIFQPGHVPICDNRWVVARYSEPDGMGGRRYRSQYYRDLRHDKTNEASLGFGAIEVHDEVHHGYSITYNHRQYPHAGSPVRAEKYVKVTGPMDHQTGISLGDHLLSRELSKYDELPSQTGIGGVIRRPVQIKSVGQRFDLNGTLMSAVVTDMPLTTNANTTSYDSFGFVKKSTVVSLDIAFLPPAIDLLNPDSFNAAGPMVHKSVTSNTYKPVTGEKWLLGRNTASEATISRPNFTTLTKKTSFTYDDNGLVTSETVEPGHALFTTTTYIRDGLYGNVVRTDVTANTEASGTPQTRVKETGYDANHRFVTSETVPGLGGSTYHYDLERSLHIGTTDLDGRTTTHTYDSFGTKIIDSFPDGTRAANITRFASNSGLPPAVRSILDKAGITIRWARYAEVSGAPVAAVFVDALGRDIVTRGAVLTSADPTWGYEYQIKLYDAKGRGYLTSNSFLGEAAIRDPLDGDGAIADTTEWTRIEYDVLDRAIKTVHPDLSTVETVAIGTDTLTVSDLADQPVAYVKVRNQGNKELERWLDVEGRLVQSKDASTQITRFKHDLEGRVREVTINHAWQLTNAYDIRGNRTMVHDLSAGRTDSVYNGFGELKQTTNDKDEVISTAYDAYGRVLSVTRPDDESTSIPPVNVEFTNTYRSTGPNKGKLATVSNPKGYLETYEYGETPKDYGKVVRTAKRQKLGETEYESLTTYNALGLVLTETDAGGLEVIHEYDALYGSFRLRSVLDDSILTQVWKAPSISRTADRLVATEELAHGVVRTTETEATTGRIREIRTLGLSRTLQDLAYTWDSVGNLLSRTDNLSTHPSGKTETFGYDALDRLAWSKIGTGSPTNHVYETNGNLTAKDDGTLTYFPGTYRVRDAKVKGAPSNNRTYDYDDIGQVTDDGRREYKWTAFGQLKQVKQESTPALENFFKTGVYAPQIPGIDPAVVYFPSEALSVFEFDAGGSRSKQTLKRTYQDGSFQEVITRYLGSLEIEDHGRWNSATGYVIEKSVHRHRIGGSLYTREGDGGPPVVRLAVILTDHIGSTDVIVRGEWNGAGWDTDTSADPAEPRSERQSFDAWGERRHGENWSNLHLTDSANRRTSAMDFDRGFTGHEMLDDFGLVHMNGRIYDPEIGRFLSPDPYVQVPEYSQNFNRYTYVLNNPLSYTDSSGHEVDGLVVAAVAIVVGIVTAGAATAAIGAAYGGAGAAAAAVGGTVGGTFGTVAVTGAVTLSWQGLALVGAVAGAFTGATNAALTGGNIAEGALEGAISGAISGGLLHGLGPSGDFLSKLGTLERGLIHVAGHGLLGGIRNEVMGTRFQDGFLSALAGAASGYIPGMDSVAGAAVNGDPVGIFTRSMIAGVIGGTASAIGGGKFANGAYTAAFQHLLNHEAGVLDSASAFIVDGVANLGMGIVQGLGFAADQVHHVLQGNWSSLGTTSYNGAMIEQIEQHKSPYGRQGYYNPDGIAPVIRDNATAALATVYGARVPPRPVGMGIRSTGPATRLDLHIDLRSKGFVFHSTSRGGIATYRHIDGRVVTVKVDGEVIPTSPRVALDGKKYNQRTDYDFIRLPDQSHKTGHFVEPIE